MANPQISAHITEETKKRVEEYVATYGIKKGFFIETAILHHLQALQEIPEDLIVPPRLLVTQESGKKILKAIESPNPPAKAMKELFQND